MSSGIAWRDAARQAFRTRTFDVVVVGGGITGAGVARDAAIRGLRVALLERDDFASGTSSRSSRLIHGGVRYLEHGYFGLVRESSRERRVLLSIAPHLVRPLAFTWPVYRGARVSRWKLNAGLWLYDALAIFRNVQRHESLTATEVLRHEPGLGSPGLLGGSRYWDAATDDARLTLANVVSAAAAGAVVLNHAQVASLATQGGKASGVVVADRIAGDQLELRAHLVVNATGPWTDALSTLENPGAIARVVGTKGVHVLVPAARVGNRGAITLLSPIDGRVMFVLPSGANTMIGTTDSATTASPETVRATQTDVAYLLDSANAFLPNAQLVAADVISAWAGIRPLVAHGNSGDPASASREHHIAIGPRGMISVTGGKLTTYRSMAAQVVDVVQRQLGARRTDARTDRETLPDVGREFACTVADVLVRRTKVAFDTRDHGSSAAPAAAADLAAAFGWTASDVARALEDYTAEVARIFSID